MRELTGDISIHRTQLRDLAVGYTFSGMQRQQQVVPQLWQESTDERALIPSLIIDAHEKSNYRDPVSPTRNLSLLTRHEQLYYHKSMKKITSEEKIIEKSENILKKLDDKIQFGHDVTTVRTPPSAVYDAYIRGSTSIKSTPLRIVRYDKRGTKHPRVASGHSSTGVSRNVLGGFYNS
jgi:hypothetical protein